MKRKILHIQVLPKLSGGSNRISLEILSGLDTEKYDKNILFSTHCGEDEKEHCRREFEKCGTKVILSDKLRRSIGISDIPAMVEIYRLCKKEKYDIVHTNSSKPGIIGRIATTLAGVPVVVHTVHGVAFHKFEKFPKRQFYWTCEMIASFFCDRIISVNKYYLKYFKSFKKKMSVIYNGLDFSLFSTPSSKRDDEGAKILFLGRIEHQKDPLTFLKAVKIVKEKYPDTIFTMVGSGTLFDECRKFIKDNGLEDNVNLAGWQSDVDKFYNTHDIFAMTSLYESFGLMFLEAGFYELPIVATNVEGIPEVVKNGETGLLCEPKNPEALATNIITLIENKEMRIRMGKAGKERSVQFTKQKMVDGYKELYNSLYEQKLGKKKGNLS